MSINRGITVGSVIAKLFTMVIDQKIATWAASKGAKPEVKLDSEKDIRTTDKVFVLANQLIGKQRSTIRQQKAGKLYCCFVDSRHCLLRFLTLCSGRCWSTSGSMDRCWTASGLCAPMTVQLCKAMKASQLSLTASWESSKAAHSAPFSLGYTLRSGLATRLKANFGHDSPSVFGRLIPLLLYADDPIIMSTTAAGLQQSATFIS